MNDPSPTTSRWRIDLQDDVAFIHSASAATPAPADWATRLAAFFEVMPDVEIVGAKRVTAGGGVFSMGEFLLHPKGFHHHGLGVQQQAYRFPEEVDCIAGGVMAVRREAFDAVGGQTLLQGELGAVELGLAIRARGGRVLAAPQVVIEDAFDPKPSSEEDKAFVERWGFDWRAADLDHVREKHAGTGLLWHPRFWSLAMPFEKYEDRPAVHWKNYAEVEVYRKRADHFAALLKKITEGIDKPRVLDLGCGDGLFAHLFARQGAIVTGLDPEATAIKQAQDKTADQTYPAAAPTFLEGSGSATPFDDDSFDVVAMLDVIEHLPNPVVVLREADRLLKPGGALLISTPAWQFGGWSDPVYHVTEYTPPQLQHQIEAATSLKVTDSGMITGIYRDIVMVGRNG